MGVFDDLYGFFDYKNGGHAATVRLKVCCSNFALYNLC